VTQSTELPVTWSPPLNVPIQHVNLSQVLTSVMHGIEQAARGEGTMLDASTLPTDDDE
jgi:hypothetical protein